MRRPIQELAERAFDVAVIGAGINGCAAAQEMAAAGYQVLLVDKGDFGSGSSSRSTRLLHCGLRYLTPGGSPYRWLTRPGRLLGALSMARAAMRARAEFVGEVPSRVRPLTFGFPVWKGMPYRPWHVDLGLRVVNAFGTDQVPLDRRFIPAGSLDSEPLFRDLRDRHRLLGVNTFTEYQFNWPERIAMDMVRDATRLGAVCRNYTPVVGLERSGSGWRIRLADAAGEAQQVTLTAALVVNTAGVWVDRVNRLADADAPRKILGTKGAHIVLRLAEEYRDRGVISFNRELLAAVGSRVTAKRPATVPCYQPVEVPGRNASPALLNDDDSVRIADLRDAAQHEQVTSLTDLLARRVGVVWSERQGREVARTAAEAVADLLHWDPERIDREVAAYERYLALIHGAPDLHGPAADHPGDRTDPSRTGSDPPHPSAPA